MKTILLSFIYITCIPAIFFLSSCERSDNNTKKDLKVSRIILKTEANPYDSVIYNFDYSIANQITITNSDLYITKVIYKFDTQNRLTEISEFHSIDGLFSQKVIEYTTSTATFISTYFYQSQSYVMDSIIFNLKDDGYPNSSTYYSSSGGIMKYNEKDEYTWENGDLTLLKMTDISHIDTLSMEFDDKPFPLNFTKLPITIFDYSGGDIFFFACNSHNFVRMAQGNDEYLRSELINYNDDNYPIKIVYKSYDGEYFKYHFEYIEK